MWFTKQIALHLSLALLVLGGGCVPRALPPVAGVLLPFLAGQSAAYLLRQLTAFRSGDRGKHPDDTYGQQMRGIALGLNEAELPMLVQTLHNLPVSTQP